MLNIQILCVGKLKEKFYIDAMAEYTKRLSAFCKCSVLELPEQRLPDSPSPGQIEAALSREASDIFAKIPQGGTLIALCIEGSLLPSEALAKKLEGWALSGASRLTFIIGGSCGLHSSVKDQAALKLSMSPMTFPHHLARVMLAEQIYRGFQINSGSKYHK
jgi:23S rRNA (pseudouridine1915-N3)-methyltransferase